MELIAMFPPKVANLTYVQILNMDGNSKWQQSGNQYSSKYHLCSAEKETGFRAGL